MGDLSSYIQMIVYRSNLYLTSVRYIKILFRAVNRDIDNSSIRCDIIRQGSLSIVKRGYTYFIFIIITYFQRIWSER